MTDSPESPPASTGSGLFSTVIARLVVPGLLLVASVACAGLMFAMRGSAEQSAPETNPARVEVVVVSAADRTARVEATGVVEPARQVNVIPQVTGAITWLSPEAVPGGRVTEGEVFARIDGRDYGLALDQAQSSVRAAQLELELERGRADIAEKEWELLRGDRDPASAPLALRGPQLEVAQQSLTSAEAARQRAQIDLSRTRFTAPFNAMVASESLEIGQVVAPGAAIATLVGTDEFWVTVSIPVSELGAVQLPGPDTPGSQALVRQDLGGGDGIVRTGEVTRLLAQLDSQTRTAQLQVTIPDPLATPEGGLPLLPGAYVDVVLEGRTMTDVVEVPRQALHGGDTVWVVEGTEGNGLLRQREVAVGWRQAETVFVTDGLSSGDRVVTSPMAVPLDGMPVQVLTGTDAGAAADASQR